MTELYVLTYNSKTKTARGMSLTWLDLEEQAAY